MTAAAPTGVKNNTGEEAVAVVEAAGGVGDESVVQGEENSATRWRRRRIGMARSSRRRAISVSGGLRLLLGRACCWCRGGVVLLPFAGGVAPEAATGCTRMGRIDAMMGAGRTTTADLARPGLSAGLALAGWWRSTHSGRSVGPFSHAAFGRSAPTTHATRPADSRQARGKGGGKDSRPCEWCMALRRREHWRITKLGREPDRPSPPKRCKSATTRLGLRRLK